jgi:hypothetical protein
MKDQRKYLSAALAFVLALTGFALMPGPARAQDAW